MVNKVKGTDAAKILLARNRMDAKDTSFKWTEIIESATENSVNVSALNAPLTYGEPEMKDYGQLVADSAAGKVYKDGTTLKSDDTFTCNGKQVIIERIDFDGFPNPGFADPQYMCLFSLKIEQSQSVNDAIDTLNAFLQEQGLTCKYDISDIKGFIAKNKDVSENLPNYYKWNGYAVGSKENFDSAVKVLHDSWNEMFNHYTEVKDEPAVKVSIYSPKLSSKTDFATILNLSVGSANYSNQIASLANVTLTVKGNELFTAGEKYALKIGLSRVDENGKFISKNTVELKTPNTVNAVTYNGGTMTLTATANYLLPDLLEEGKYAIVVYVATESEGIRVSQLNAIAFAQIENETIENVYYKIEVTQNDSGTVIVESMPKQSINATIAFKESYTYADVYKALMQKLLNVGYPTNNTQIQLQDGTIVSETDAILPGVVYKMKFKISTADGVVDAYVYCETPISAD